MNFVKTRPNPLVIGDWIHGFAQGYFGRDSYNCRVLEARGVDWAVFRTTDGGVELAGGDDLTRLPYLRDGSTAEHTFGCPCYRNEQENW